MAPVKMDDTRRYEIALAGFGALTANGVQASSQAGSRDPGQYKIAVAQLGHLSDEGTVEISEFERNASRIINAQFDAAPLRNEKLVPPVIWHDSMAWTEKGIRLGVVTGLTERDQQAAAKALADRVGADLLIWGGEVITETDRGLAFRFYSRELYEGEEMIDESQLGAPASSIDDINSYARAFPCSLGPSITMLMAATTGLWTSSNAPRLSWTTRSRSLVWRCLTSSLAESTIGSLRKTVRPRASKRPSRTSKRR